jgi:hypothetical protein
LDPPAPNGRLLPDVPTQYGRPVAVSSFATAGSKSLSPNQIVFHVKQTLGNP